ncbi:hypothetical protein ACW2QC_00255 [Virgibacillus sp. FSP13]
MQNKLLPIYREKELYTLFYDQENNHLYKIQHRKKSFGVFFILMLAVFYGSKIIDGIYQEYQDPLLNTILFFAALALGYFVAQSIYGNYYIEETKREIFLDSSAMEQNAIAGMKQLRIEIYASIVALILALLAFVLFFIYSEILLLVIGTFGVATIMILLFMKPFARIKVLKKFKRREIEL